MLSVEQIQTNPASKVNSKNQCAEKEKAKPTDSSRSLLAASQHTYYSVCSAMVKTAHL